MNARARASSITAAACCLGAVALGTPHAASAEYFFSESGAEKVTRDVVFKRYGYSRYTLGVSCRPQGRRKADPAYTYHRWVCGWAASGENRCDGIDESVGGRVLLIGRSGRGRYSYIVQRGAQCG